MKGASPLVSAVLLTAISIASVMLFVTLINPAINKMKDSLTMDEAVNNLEQIYSIISKVASESEGSRRVIYVRVSDGAYKLDASKDIIYFEYKTKGGLRLSGKSGNVHMEPSPIFFDYFNNYQENSNASGTWVIKNGTWQVSNARYYGSNNAIAYKVLGSLKDFEIAGKIINLRSSIPGEIFIVPKDPESLVLYLPFDEGTGTTAWDYSGYNNTGTLYNGSAVCYNNDCPRWVNGKFEKAIEFDGINDYVNVPNDISLQITEDLTICGWVKPYSITSDQEIVGKQDYRVEYAFGITSTGELYLIFGNGTNYNSQFTSSGANLQANTWYFVCGVRNATSKIEKFYKNGDFISQNTYTINIVSSSNDVNVGQRSSTKKHFNGTIDEVKIWDRALSEEEIKAEYILGLKKLIQSGVEQISLPDWLNLSLVLSSPYGAYFDDISVRTNENKMKLILPLRDVDLTGSLHIGKGSHQIVIENEGVNAATNKPIIEISVV